MQNTRSFLNYCASAALTVLLLTVATETPAPPGGGGPGGGRFGWKWVLALGSTWCIRPRAPLR